MEAKRQRIVVAGFMLDGGKVLLARRAATKTLAPDKFHLPGGHVEYGETVQEALAREIVEEFAVRIVALEPYFAFSDVVGDVHTIGVACPARLAEPKENIRLKRDETDEVVWPLEEELLDYLASDDHNYQAAVLGFRRWGRV